MRKWIVAILVMSLFAVQTVMADELVINAEIAAGGAEASSITIIPQEPLPASVEAEFRIEVTTPSRNPTVESEPAPLKLYTIDYAPDGTITLGTEAFAPSSALSISYVIPAAQATETAAATEEQVLKTWTNAQDASVKYAIVDDFTTGTYTGSYKDAAGADVELTIAYRLYIPENAGGQALPLVVTMHGSGESGDDNLSHVTASQITTCWADPAWQQEHPCYVFAPQWPASDVSNDLELRDRYLAVYRDMIAEIQTQYQTGKTYLASLSMGSRLGFRYMTLYPDAFDACLMCCGAMQNADLTAISEKPVWLVHAVSDFVNKAQGSVDAFNQMNGTAGNPNVHLTLLTDDGMNGVFSHASWQFVYGNRDYMEWLFAQ